MGSTLLFQESLPQIYAKIDPANFGPSVDFGFVPLAPETPLKPIQVTSTLKPLPQKQLSLMRWLLNKLRRSPAKKSKRTRLISLNDIKANSNATDDENKVSISTLDIVAPPEVKRRASWTSAITAFMHRNSRASVTSSNQQESPVSQKSFNLDDFVPILLDKGVIDSNYSVGWSKFKHVRIDKTTIYIGKKRKILLKDCCLRPAMTTSSHHDCLEIIESVAVKGKKGRRNQGTRLVLVLRDSGQLEKWRDEIEELMQNAFQTDLLSLRVDDDHEEAQEKVAATAAKSEVSSEGGMKWKKSAEEMQDNLQFVNDAKPMKKEDNLAKSITEVVVASCHTEKLG